MCIRRRWGAAGTAALVMALSLAPLRLVPSSAAASTPAGPSWTIEESPNAGTATGRLAAVACPSESECWAVGNGWPGLSGSASIAHWTGEEWTLVPTPSDPNRMTYLYDAACASETECFAVGSVSNPLDVFTGFVPLFMHSAVFRWDGTSWSREEIPLGDEDAGSGRFSLLRGVDCGGPGDCWAIGAVREDGMNDLFLHWDGAEWVRTDVSETLGDENLVLGSISCPEADFCMAVGALRDSFVVSNPRATSAAMWDGTQWTLAPAPAGHLPDDSADHWLGGISCVAADDCWAVGDADVTEGTVTGATTTLPFASHWDGAAWATSAVPAAPSDVPIAPGGIETHLADVSCVAANDCWAVGHSNNNGAVQDAANQDFVLRWNGTAWLPGPALPEPTATFGGTLRSIHCPTSARCWAVGQVTPAEQIHERMATWDGSAWSSVAAPAATAVSSNRLLDVTCVAVDDCWGVGSYFYGQLGRTLTQHWNGETWSVVPSPNTAEDRYNSLTSVSCLAPDDCWAVGNTSSWNQNYRQPMALHWDGTAWSLSDPIPVPVHRATKALDENLGTVDVIEQATLQSIDCAAVNDCWGVGMLETMAVTSVSIVPTHSKPFFVHWDGVAWQPMIGLGQELSPMTESIIYDVDCISPTDCTAVGQQFARFEYNFLAGADARTLIAHWDGVAWTAVASPNVGPHINQLYAVACSAPECWAVGDYYLDYPYSGTPRQAPLALHMDANGTWQVATLPENARPLSGVACAATDDCWAVGSPPSLESPSKTTAVHWDGTEWATASSPSKLTAGKPTTNVLSGVACDSGTDCWAVGHYQAGRDSQTLMLHYAESGLPGPKATQVRFTELSAESGQFSDTASLEASLSDSDGQPISNAELRFDIVGAEGTRSFTATTDEQGIAGVTPSLSERPGLHQVMVRFDGNVSHAGHVDTASFIVEKEDTKIELKVEGQGNSKILSARLSDLDTTTNELAGRDVNFYSNGELIGSSATDDNGVATLPVPAGHRGGKRAYEAVFEPDDYYLGSSDQEGGEGTKGNGGPSGFGDADYSPAKLPLI